MSVQGMDRMEALFGVWTLGFGRITNGTVQYFD